MKQIIQGIPAGYLDPPKVNEILEAAGIPLLPEKMVHSADEAVKAALELGFPVVMKVVGPVHKSDVGGVKLNINDEAAVRQAFQDMMAIKDARGVLLQPMIKGLELFAGVKYEEKFGHLILCGMGGIFIEVLKDFSAGLAPISANEAKKMIERLKMYPDAERNARAERHQPGAVCRDTGEGIELVRAVPAIREMDLNPLMAPGIKLCRGCQDQDRQNNYLQLNIDFSILIYIFDTYRLLNTNQ